MSRYNCSICNTTPTNRSAHKTHLLNEEHKNKYNTFVRNMKLFSHAFRQISPSKWDRSPEAEYIANQYREETGNEPNFTDIQNWINHKGLSEPYLYDGWTDKREQIFNVCSSDEYYEMTGVRIAPIFNIHSRYCVVPCMHLYYFT